MKDWKTYAIVALATWCFWITKNQPHHEQADLKKEIQTAIKRIDFDARVKNVLMKMANPVEVKEDPADAEAHQIWEGKYKSYLADAKESRPFWIKWKNGEKVHTEHISYDVFIRKFFEAKDAPNLLKARLDKVRQYDEELCVMIEEDIRR